MVTEQHVGPRTEPTLRDLSEALAGEIKPYSQAEFNVLAAEGRPIARFPRRLVRYVRSASARDPRANEAKQIQRPDDVHH
jgi:hypothetical protein